MTGAETSGDRAQWERLRELFDTALALPAHRRLAFAADATKDDPGLGARLDDLLRAHEESGSTFLEAPAIASVPGMPAPPAPLAAGTVISSYEIGRPLGAGSMGEVYEARDFGLKRAVAIKILPAALAGHPDRVRRFRLEARAAGALNHPNIRAIHSLGVIPDNAAGMDGRQGAPFLVCELLEGESLRTRLGRLPVPAGTAMRWGRQIVSALEAAHARGIVHRDLKPENLFVTTDGVIKILDYGLAKLTQPASDEDSAGTIQGTILGTPGYMAPEQLRGVEADHRADIFSTGAILYEMLTGHRAFPASTAGEARRLFEDPETAALAAGLSGLGPPLEGVIRGCLEQSRARRFQCAADLSAALAAAM